VWSTRLFAPRAANLTTFGEDSSGQVYLATENGTLARIADPNPPPPTLVSVEPATGSSRGGESVVVTGGGFVLGTTVSFGGVAAPEVAVLDSNGTRLRVVTPPRAAGPVDVVVSNPDGRSATLPGGYTFTAVSRAATPPRAPQTVARP
jgi:hypothetical protein